MAASFDPGPVAYRGGCDCDRCAYKNREYTEAHNGDSVNYTGLVLLVAKHQHLSAIPRWGRGQGDLRRRPIF